jgi:geranylgeranyl pyrophosphate synthase
MEAAGGDARTALPIAVAFELLHVASLIHDDIMDSARVRRRRSCVHRVFGVPMAITAGDALIFAAYGWIQRLSAHHPVAAAQVLDIFTRAADRTCRGQAQDLAIRGRRSTMAEYLRMVRAKTGSMIEAPLESAAVLAGAPSAWRRRLREYGRCLGIAFQILDDALDCLGSERRVGKTLGNDLRRGGATALVIYSREILGPGRGDVAAGGRADDRGGPDRWRGVFHEVGAVDFTRGLCARYAERAVRALSGIEPTAARSQLAAIACTVADWGEAGDAAEEEAAAGGGGG